jgi:hypothetical protein
MSALQPAFAMIVGNPNLFAIESEIVVAFERRLFLAYGSFVVHIGGRLYGDKDPKETPLLSNALREVEFHLAERGCHRAPFASEPDAGRIANAFQDCHRNPIWASDEEKEWFCGFTQAEFLDLTRTHHCEWGDFDHIILSDVSVILQFDVGDRVRLIAFRAIEEDWHHDPATLANVWLDADEFYHILREWRDAFEAEWAAAPKITKAEDGANSFIKEQRAAYGQSPYWDEAQWE